MTSEKLTAWRDVFGMSLEEWFVEARRCLRGDPGYDDGDRRE